MVSRVRGYGSDQAGNVGIIFGLTLLPMIGMTGLGVDYARTIAARTAFSAAADAAALAAATQAQATLQATGGNSAGVSSAQVAGQYAGQQVFNANAAKAGSRIGGAPTPNVTLTVNGQVITAQVSYQTKVPTVFGGMFGVKTMTIGNTASSSLKLPSYLNISVAVDVSQSMGLAATSADMTKLQGLTGCAFGCHLSDNGGTSNEDIAHSNGVTLRIDVIREATKNMIATAQSLQGSAGLISFGLYTMSGGPNPPLATLSPPSTNYAALTTAANSFDLGTNNPNHIGESDFPDALSALTKAVPASGDGRSASNPQQFVFLMTDGVNDTGTYSNTCGVWLWGHCTGPFDPAQCANLKNKGVTVGVIYTTYLPMYGVDSFDKLVAPFWNQIASNVQACASPGWFYQASDATDIQAAINALFAKATGRGVLTQ